MKLIKNILMFFFVIISAVISCVIIAEMAQDPWGVRIKKYGTDLEKFHLLLEENIQGYSIDFGYEKLTIPEKACALQILHAINYKRDCTQAPKKFIGKYYGDNILSCTVNGKKIEYQFWYDFDQTANETTRFYPCNLD